MKINEFEDILYEKEENGICTLTFNKPERRNALSQVSFLEIETVLEDMEQDKNTRVLIITGCEEANAFSSGGYFNMRYQTQIPQKIREQIDFSDIAQKKLCMKFWDFPKPVITAINGLAIGAGITMPLAVSDLIFMSEDAWIGFYFVERGLIPEFAASFVLPFYLGFQKAKEILYFGDNITAQKALELGLVNDVIPAEELLAHARKIALQLVPPNSPSVALKLMKKSMHDYFRDIISKTLDIENESIHKAFTTHDFRESTKALAEKREPIFKGK